MEVSGDHSGQRVPSMFADTPGPSTYGRIRFGESRRVLREARSSRVGEVAVAEGFRHCAGASKLLRRETPSPP